MNTDKYYAYFTVFSEQQEFLDFMTHEQKGKLLDALYNYTNGYPNSFDDDTVGVAFQYLKAEFEKERYEYFN